MVNLVLLKVYVLRFHSYFSKLTKFIKLVPKLSNSFEIFKIKLIYGKYID